MSAGRTPGRPGGSCWCPPRGQASCSFNISGIFHFSNILLQELWRPEDKMLGLLGGPQGVQGGVAGVLPEDRHLVVY